MERTYINEFHKQWIESTLKSIASWQKQPISLEEKKKQQDDQYFRQADFAQKQRVNEHHCFIGFRSLRGGVSASAQM